MAKIKVIIGFKEGELLANADSMTSMGGEVKNLISSIDAIVVEIDKDKESEFVQNLSTLPNVKYYEISTEEDVHILGFNPERIMDSVRKSTQFVQGTVVPWNIAKIKAPDLWAKGFRGQNIKGCIIDTGIDYNHPNLKDAYKGGYNFINNTSDPMDDQGHGSHVAGIAAARDLGTSVGLVGVAPEMSIYACKVLNASGSGSYANIISAIQWCIENDIDIINMSLGGGSYSQALEDICKVAYEAHNILIIAAAGNADGNLGQDTIVYPARYGSCVAVGATDNNDARASFSSVGAKLEICAPGVSIYSSVPSGNCQLCSSTGYRVLNGTSMACPHVFGVGALLLSANFVEDNDVLSSSEIRSRMNHNSVDLGIPGRDTLFGFGRVDALAAYDDIPPVPPVPKKYRCSGAPDYICIEDSNGTFDSIEKCQAACKKPIPPPSDTKFNVSSIGIGVLVIKSPFGQDNAETACAKACEIIRKL